MNSIDLIEMRRKHYVKNDNSTDFRWHGKDNKKNANLMHMHIEIERGRERKEWR